MSFHVAATRTVASLESVFAAARVRVSSLRVTFAVIDVGTKGRVADKNQTKRK
jgi:hypothetical protein